LLYSRYIGIAYIVSTWLCLSACTVYKQNIMFRPQKYPLSAMSTAVGEIERNYRIQANDLISFQLYANKGERLVDLYVNPLQTVGGTFNNQQNTVQGITYQVRENGYASLPLIGQTYLRGFTLRQTDSLLQKAFEKFYHEPYVITRFANKRVVVLGTNNQIVPLVNDKMTVIEVIALSGGVQTNAKVRKIRIIRGDLNRNPQVFLVDLSTIEGMKNSQLLIEPGDIIYIEPVRRTLFEGLNDVSSLTGIFSTLISTILIITTLTR
jgi:polysaccharide export outer membrane protein